MLLFLRGSAHFTFLRAGPRAPHAPLLTPSPATSRGLRVRRVGAPLPKQRRAARTRRGRAAVGRDAFGAPAAGQSQAPCPPPRHLSTPLLDPPSLCCLPPPRRPPRRLLPPKPLLHTGLRPSVTAVYPLPVSAPLSCSVPQSTAASSPPDLARATRPLHTRRRPPELPRHR
jgi:hypothetical protein